MKHKSSKIWKNKINKINNINNYRKNISKKCKNLKK